MMQVNDIRVGNADRERVAVVLQRHVTDGRLTMDEYATRIEAAYRARTIGELDAIAADLPALDPDSAVAHHDSRRRWPALVGLAVAGLAALVYLGPLLGGPCCSW